VVDDQEDSRDVLRQAFTFFGAAVTLAATA
jgi:CheY-like chemotaxis protein